METINPMNLNNIPVTFTEVLPELTQSELLKISLASCMAVEITKVIDLLRNIDIRYRNGKMSKHDMSLPVWSAYDMFCKYMHIVDVEWLNMLESND